jgi:hypothetical protein
MIGSGGKDRLKQRSLMLRQLGERTKVVETIKADVAKSQLEIIEAVKSEFAQRDWASRERATLRRVKIEELLGKVNECRAYLERYQKAAAEGDGLEERDPITELRAIAKLYLPELAAQTKAFSDMHELQVHEGLLHRHKLSRLSTEEKQRELKMDYGWQVAKSKKSGEADALIEAWNAVQELICRPQSSDSCPPSFGPVSALRRIPQLGQPTWLDDMPPRRAA